jgi:hypothetical protein
MEREAAITAVLGAVQERWGIHSLTRGYSGARVSGALAFRASRAAPPPALPPWWPGAEGYLRPAVLELSGPASCGKLGLALLWLAAASRGGLVAVVDLAGTFYPPAAAASGLDLGRLVVVRPPDRRGAAEAVSLLLTSAGFDAILWPVEWRTRPLGLDSARLATLAARSGTTLLALVTDRRRASIDHGGADDGAAGRLFPSADVRLRVTGWEWSWRDGELAGVRPRVRTERLRGAVAGQAWELRLEHHGQTEPADVDPARTGPVHADEASSRAIRRGRVLGAGSAGADTTDRAAGSNRPGVGFVGLGPGGCPPSDHLCLAAALPLGGRGTLAAEPAGAADRGVRSDPATASAARHELRVASGEWRAG